MADLFNLAFRYVVLNEGEQSNHPTDRGGLTRWGITEYQAKNHRCLEHPEGIDVRKVDLALAKHIYLEDYWEFSGIKSPQVAVKLFDYGVNFGVRTAVKLAQETVNSMGKAKLTVDGILGKLSADAINAIDPQRFLDQLEIHADDRYWSIIYNSLVARFGKKEVDKTQAVFGRGWFRRSNKRFYIAEGDL